MIIQEELQQEEYLEGDRIDIIEFYKGNIKKVKSTEHKSSDLYIDLTNF